MFQPGSKKWFGLKRTDSNFELFAAHCLIDMCVFLSRINDRLEAIEKGLQTPEPTPKPKAKTKAKAKSKSKAKGKK
jgi:hypothetical protein